MKHVIKGKWYYTQLWITKVIQAVICTSIKPARQLHIRGTNLDWRLKSARSFSLSMTSMITTCKTTCIWEEWMPSVRLLVWILLQYRIMSLWLAAQCLVPNGQILIQTLEGRDHKSYWVNSRVYPLLAGLVAAMLTPSGFCRNSLRSTSSTKFCRIVPLQQCPSLLASEFRNEIKLVLWVLRQKILVPKLQVSNSNG